MVYSDDKDILTETKQSQQKKDTPVEHLDHVVEMESEINMEQDRMDLKMTLQSSLEDLFTFYFQYDIPKVHFMSYNDIIKIIDNGKEIEKQSVKKYFAGLQATSSDLFRAEVSMKRLNLGRYFINQKNLITYGKKVDNFYDDKEDTAEDLKEFGGEATEEDILAGEDDNNVGSDDEPEDDDEFVPLGEDDDTGDIFGHGNDN